MIGGLEADYKLVIPPYYFSLIDPDDPAIRSACSRYPSPREAENPSGYELEDPLEEDKDSPVPGVTHRYPDRALLVTTPAAPCIAGSARASARRWPAAAGTRSAATTSG